MQDPLLGGAAVAGVDLDLAVVGGVSARVVQADRAAGGRLDGGDERGAHRGMQQLRQESAAVHVDRERVDGAGDVIAGPQRGRAAGDLAVAVTVYREGAADPAGGDQRQAGPVAVAEQQRVAEVVDAVCLVQPQLVVLHREHGGVVGVAVDVSVDDQLGDVPGLRGIVARVRAAVGGDGVGGLAVVLGDDVVAASDEAGEGGVGRAREGAVLLRIEVVLHHVQLLGLGVVREQVVVGVTVQIAAVGDQVVAPRTGGRALRRRDDHRAGDRGRVAADGAVLRRRGRLGRVAVTGDQLQVAAACGGEQVGAAVAGDVPGSDLGLRVPGRGEGVTHRILGEVAGPVDRADVQGVHAPVGDLDRDGPGGGGAAGGRHLGGLAGGDGGLAVELPQEVVDAAGLAGGRGAGVGRGVVGRGDREVRVDVAARVGVAGSAADRREVRVVGDRRCLWRREVGVEPAVVADRRSHLDRGVVLGVDVPAVPVTVLEGEADRCVRVRTRGDHAAVRRALVRGVSVGVEVGAVPDVVVRFGVLAGDVGRDGGVQLDVAARAAVRRRADPAGRAAGDAVAVRAHRLGRGAHLGGDVRGDVEVGGQGERLGHAQVVEIGTGPGLVAEQADRPGALVAVGDLLDLVVDAEGGGAVAATAVAVRPAGHGRLHGRIAVVVESSGLIAPVGVLVDRARGVQGDRLVVGAVDAGRVFGADLHLGLDDLHGRVEAGGVDRVVRPFEAVPAGAAPLLVADTLAVGLRLVVLRGVGAGRVGVHLVEGAGLAGHRVLEGVDVDRVVRVRAVEHRGVGRQRDGVGSGGHRDLADLGAGAGACRRGGGGGSRRFVTGGEPREGGGFDDVGRVRRRRGGRRTGIPHQGRWTRVRHRAVGGGRHHATRCGGRQVQAVGVRGH